MTDRPDRLRAVIVAGHRGLVDEARTHLDDVDDRVRAAALGAVARTSRLTDSEVGAALRDPSPRVRRRAAEVAIGHPDIDLTPWLADDDPSVVEVVAWALGERPTANPEVIGGLVRVTTGHDQALCREAAVAALGARGEIGGLAAILQACGDRATVRRRAVLALASFAGPDVDAALDTASNDRDWQVRQAAEDLLAARSDELSDPTP